MGTPSGFAGDHGFSLDFVFFEVLDFSLAGAGFGVGLTRVIWVSLA